MKRRSLALLSLGLSALISSCGERMMTEPAAAGIQASVNEDDHHRNRHRGRRRGQPPHLVKCRPQRPDIAIKRIGSGGGHLEVGPYTLTVPSGALSRNVFIVARIRAGESVNVVEFWPDGLVFQKPASLSMSYSNCDVQEDNEDDVRIALVDDAYQILAYLATTKNDKHRIVADVEHFSNYAVAW